MALTQIQIRLPPKLNENRVASRDRKFSVVSESVLSGVTAPPHPVLNQAELSEAMNNEALTIVDQIYPPPRS